MKLRPSYDADLDALSQALIHMGALAADAIARTLTALKTGDRAMAQSVIDADAELDRAERDIEHRCLTLLLCQQPVAGDLRKVSTAIKMITDIERVGDAAADIAEIGLHMKDTNLPAALPHIEKMAETAQKMVEDAIRAYVDEDLQLAADVIQRDDEVDAGFNAVKGEIAQLLSKDIDGAVDCLMIAKYLERLGDHAVNICEWVQFYKTGVHKNEKIL